MSRKRIKTITREEFDQFITLLRGYADLNNDNTTWDNIPKQEQIRFERDFCALSVKLYHTLGFKDDEKYFANQLQDMQDKLDIYQELNSAEDKMLREKNKDNGTLYPGLLSKLDKLKREDPERFKKEQKAFNKPNSFREAFDKLNKINK